MNLYNPLDDIERKRKRSSNGNGADQHGDANVLPRKSLDEEDENSNETRLIYEICMTDRWLKKNYLISCTEKTDQ